MSTAKVTDHVGCDAGLPEFCTVLPECPTTRPRDGVRQSLRDLNGRTKLYTENLMRDAPPDQSGVSSTTPRTSVAAHPFGRHGEHPVGVPSMS
jgi:hypothetical protein